MYVSLVDQLLNQCRQYSGRSTELHNYSVLCRISHRIFRFGRQTTEKSLTLYNYKFTMSR